MKTDEQEKFLASAKKWAIAGCVVTYIAAATLATVYGSAAAYQAIHKQAPHELTLRSTYDYYAATRDDPKEHKKLLFVIGLPAFLLFLVGPLVLLGMTGERRDLFGNERFANNAEVLESGLLGTKGIILGKHRGRYLMMDGPLSVLMSAPTRSWKGVAIVVPNALNWSESMVVLDVKPELFRITAGFRAAHGQKVFAWAPFAEDGRSHGYNPLSYIRTGYRFVVGDTLAIGQIIYPAPVNANGSSIFFADNARNLFLGMVLYLVETPELPRTIGEMQRQASGNGSPIKPYLQKIIADRAASDRPLSDKCVNALQRFLNTADDVLSSILSTLNAPLLVFEDALVDAATSKNDFLLTDLRRQRMTVYVCIPVNRLADAAVLLNLFYAQLVNLNTDQLPEDNPDLKHQVLIINDEFTTMGRVEAFSKGIGYMAGFGLRILTVIQSRSQLESKYGKEDARNYTTNHGAEILFAPREQRDADEYSAALGHYTEKQESKGRSSSGKSGSSHSTNTSDAKRPVLWPQEFKRIGLKRAVVVVENVRPIMADKICYYKDPVFKARLLKPPALPQIDLEMHQARIERRIRTLAPGEVLRVEDLAADFASLPALTADATDEDQKAFVTAFYKQMALAAASTSPGKAKTSAEADPAAATAGSPVSTTPEPTVAQPALTRPEPEDITP